MKLVEILLEPTDEVPFDASYDSTTLYRVRASSGTRASSRVVGDSLIPE